MRPQRNVLTTRPSRHKHTHLPPSPTPSTHSFLHFHIFSTWTLPMGLNTAHGNNNQRHNKRKPTHPHLLPSSTNTHNTAQLQISWRFIEHANLPHTDMARHGTARHGTALHCTNPPTKAAAKSLVECQKWDSNPRPQKWTAT